MLTLARGSYEYESTVTLPGAGTQVSGREKSSTKLLPGVYSGVGLSWHVNDHFSLLGQVRYQFMRQFSLNTNGSNANLSFNSAMVLLIGASYLF